MADRSWRRPNPVSGLTRLVDRPGVRSLLVIVLAASLAVTLPATSDARQGTSANPAIDDRPFRAELKLAFPADIAAQIPESTFAWMEANDWTTEWRQGPGPGRQAEARYNARTIVIWRTDDRSVDFWAGAFAHELGHAVSHTHLSADQMVDWNTLRGLSSWEWEAGAPDDFAVGEGDFAEAFMHYLTGHHVRSKGGVVTPAVVDWIQANTPF